MNGTLQQRIILRRKLPTRYSTAGGPLSSESTRPTMVEVDLQSPELTAAEAADIRRDPEVVAIAEPMPLKLIEPVGQGEPTPAAVGNTWGIEAIGADTSPFDGSGITVAVLDTGVNPSHVAFQGVSLERRNFTQEGDDDTNGHGTHCAGTIFGRDVNGLRIGVARGVTKAVIGKVLGAGGGSSADLSNAIIWAYEEGANVISMSLGIDFPGFVQHLVRNVGLEIEPATSMALEQYRANINLFSALSLLLNQSQSFSQPAIIVAASGNESDRPRYTIAVAPPAAGDGLIAVGALEKSAAGNLSVARFSNTQCDLCAPGVSVTSAWIGGNDALHTISGTSMATPHVAGCAALWAQQQKELIGSVTTETILAKTLASSQFIPGGVFEDIGSGIVKSPH